MKEVERPASVLVTPRNYNLNRFPDAAVGFDPRIAQIVESAQDVVVPERREREAKPAFIDDFARSERAKHTALKQIILGASACVCDCG